MTAPKKKPATPDKVTAKKAVSSSVSREKKLPTPKKNIVVPKKNTSGKIKQASFQPTVQPRFFSWAQWSQTFNLSIDCWRSILPRYCLILFLTLGLNLLGFFTMSTILLSILGGVTGLESLVANLVIGTLPDPWVIATSLLIFLFWLGFAIYINVLSKVSVFALIKDYIKGQKVSVVSLFFQEGNRFFLRYLVLSLSVFFYVIWPVLVFLGLVLAWDLLVSTNLVQTASLESFIPFVSMALVLGILSVFGYVIYAVIRVLFAQSLLIQTDKSAGEAFRLAKKITARNWWFNFLMWGLYVVLLYALNIILAEISYLDPIILIAATEVAEALRFTDLLAFLMSLFIFGPITSAFLYFLMLRSATNQSVKI